ncbi:MAG TPA: Mur ligase domain-containing protein [Candidatus Limnocylindrales bacterium]
MTERAAPRAGGAGAPGEPVAGLTADELVAASGGHLLTPSSQAVLGATVDSREVIAGNLFVAVPGERTDGHRFIGQAAERGATAVLVSARPGEAELTALRARDVAVILVDDILRAFAEVAASWRGRFDPLVVGVTGSIAKTSSKEAIATVLG